MRALHFLALLALGACSSQDGAGGSGNETGTTTDTCPDPPQTLGDVPCNGTVPGGEDASLEGTPCANIGETCECTSIQCISSHLQEGCQMTCTECHVWTIHDCYDVGFGGGGSSSNGGGGAGGS